jgi:O-antigen/teichoic acid export membrane protein
MKRIVQNYGFNLTYQIFLLIVPVVTTPYVSRVLGAAGVGVNSYTSSIAQYFILLGMFGFSLYGSRQIAYTRDNEERRSGVFWSIYINQISFVVLTSLIFLVIALNSKAMRVPLLIQGISVLACCFDVSWYFFGLEQFSVTVLRNFIVKLLSIVAIFTLVRSSDDLNMYILINALSVLIGNLALVPFLKRSVVLIHITISSIMDAFKASSLLFIPQLAVSIYIILNKTILGLLKTTTEVGYFDSSDKIIRLLLTLMTSAGTVVMPFIAHEFSRGSHNLISRITKLTIQLTAFLAVPMTIGVTLIASRFVPLFFGSGFEEVVPVMILEAPVIIFVGITSVTGNQYLLPTGQSKKYTVSLVMGAIVDLIVIFPLAMKFGALGAAGAVLCAEMTVCFIQIYFIRQEIDFTGIITESLKYVLGAFLMIVPAVLINMFIRQDLLAALLIIVTGGFIYVLAETLFKPEILSWIVNKIVGRRGRHAR